MHTRRREHTTIADNKKSDQNCELWQQSEDL